MSVTYGFYNSLNHDRKYDATQLSEIFDGIIHDGVYELLRRDDGTITKKFMVEATGTGFQVTVDEGRAWFYHTWTKNDAKIVINLPAAPTVVNKYRYDTIILDIDANTNVRENKITYVSGPEGNSQTPTKPELINSGLHHQIPLAYVLRVGRETVISQSNITIAVGSSECPYVAGVIDFIDISNHIKQFQAAWDEWFAGFTTTNVDSFENWKEQQQEIYDRWLADLQRWTSGKQAVFQGWMDNQQSSFEEWFENLQYILDGDVAGHLQMEIERLASRVTPIEYGGTGNAHGHIQSGYQTSTWFDDPMGEYATAEGMNAVASGKCAHAEGGGTYSSEYVAAHLEDNGRKIATDSTNQYYDYGHHMNCSISKTVSGSASQDVTWYDISGDTNNDLGYNYIIGSNDEYKWGPDDSSPYLHGRIVSAYLYVELKDETSDEILKNVVLTEGDNVEYSFAYGNGSRIKGNGYKNVIADGIYEEVNQNVIVGYDDNHDPIYERYNYWYMDGTTPENSTVIFSLVPYMSLYNYKAYIGYMGGLNSQDPSIFNSKTKNHGLLIKAGNTHTYSIKMYCAYTMENECLADQYYRKDVPNAVHTFSVQSGTADGVTELIDLETIKSIAVEWVDYNGVCISRNVDIPIRTNQSSATKDTEAYICCMSDNNEVIAVKLRYDYSQQKWTHIFIAPNEDASSSYGGSFRNNYTVKVSDHKLPGYTMSKIVDGVEKGFEYYLKWIPAHDGLAATSPPTRAIGAYSHAEGCGTKAVGRGAHAEGYYERISSIPSHYVDGDDYPGAYGDGSHSEGIKTKAMGPGAHSEGRETIAYGQASHAEGHGTQAYNYAHSEGHSTIAEGSYSHSEGDSSRATAPYAHAEGYNTRAGEEYTHVEGYECTAYAAGAHVEGYQSAAYSSEQHGDAAYSHAGGLNGYAHLLGQFVHGNFGFGGTAKEFINTDGTVTFPDVPSAFNGGSFYFKNTESSSKSVSVNLIYNSDRGTGTPEGLRGTWLIIKRDVPVSGVSNAAGNAGVWLAMVKNTTGGILLHKIFESETTAAACTMASDGTLLRFTIKGSGSNNGLAAAVQIIRIM